MAGVEILPERAALSHAIATQLACWAKMENGMTDPRVQYLTCCKSGYWQLPAELCAEYGPLPFTSRGEEIPCDPDAEFWSIFYVTEDDVEVIDPNTCEPVNGDTLAAPSGLSAGDITEDSIEVSWDDVENADGYVVAYSSDGGDTWTEETTADTEYTIEGLDAGTEYLIQVRATDSTGEYNDSPFSAPITVTTDGEPPEQLDTPENFAANEVSTTSISFLWDAVADADEYVVQWSLAGEDEWTSIDPVTDPDATVEDLSPDTEYDFRVRAEADGWAPSEWSDIVTETTSDAPQLDTPQDLIVAGQNEDSIEVDWSAVDNADQYVVRWSLAGAEDWTEEDPVGITGHLVEGLDADTEYDFQVKAIADEYVDSEWSDTATGSTDGGPLDTPQNVAAGTPTDTTIPLTWDAVDNATGYIIQYSDDGGDNWEVETSATASVTLEELTPDTEYMIQVIATDSTEHYSDSEPSDVLVVSTEED